MKKAVALGTFDGLHKGHRAVLELASGFETVAVTFEIPPRAVISGKRELLMNRERRYEGLYSLGVSRVVPLRFEEVRDMSAEDFLDMLKREFEPQLIVCGFNYRFGKNAAGDTEMLRRFCDSNAIEFKCCEPVFQEGETVSASALRRKIREGDMKTAAGRIYGGFSFDAVVINGDHRGRTIGFPTINQQYPDDLVLPKFGVYAVKVCFDGKVFNGVSNIGVRPTYKTREVFSETYIKDFSGDLYGKKVTIKPIRFLREERRFSSVDELKNAILADVTAISDN